MNSLEGMPVEATSEVETVLASGGMVPDVVAPPPPPENTNRRVTVWNRDTKRKISGNAAPMEKNLSEYLRRHPECELFSGQDQQLNPAEKAALIAAQNRIAIWNKVERRRVSGNAAPSEKNLHEYLRKHPECEIYNGQDKRAEEWASQAHKTASVNFSDASRNRSAATPVSRPSQPMMRSGAMAIPSSKPRGVGSSAMPIPTNMSSADLSTGATEAAFATDPFAQDVFSMSGSLGKMSGRSLEDMMMGMSMDSTMEGMGDSVEDLLSGSPGNLDGLGSFGDHMGLKMMEGRKIEGKGGQTEGKAMEDKGAQPMECPISPAQRIKRDRSLSTHQQLGGHAISLGSQQGNPAQRMRQGPGPGSLKSDDVLGWSISPSMLDDELALELR